MKLQLEPPRRVGAHTKLRFRYFVTGTASVIAQIFDATDLDNRHVRLDGLAEEDWAFAYVDFTRDGERNDGSDTPFDAGHFVDDLFFFLQGDAELFVDEVCLFDAGE